MSAERKRIPASTDEPDMDNASVGIKMYRSDVDHALDCGLFRNLYRNYNWNYDFNYD